MRRRIWTATVVSAAVLAGPAMAQDSGLVEDPGMGLGEILLLAAAVALAIGYLYRRLFRSKSPCAGCGTAKSCVSKKENPK
jgi:hypothetical protein